MALSSSSMCRHSCHHCNGIVSLVVMALLPSMHRRLHHCHDWNCCPRKDGVVAVVKRRCPCHCEDNFVALITMVSLPLICNCVVALALLLSSSWRCCPCCNSIVVTINAQVSLLPLLWHEKVFNHVADFTTHFGNVNIAADFFLFGSSLFILWSTPSPQWEHSRITSSAPVPQETNCNHGFLNWRLHYESLEQD